MTQSIGSIKFYQGSAIELLVRNSDGTRKVLTGKVGDIDEPNNRLSIETGVGPLFRWADLSAIALVKVSPDFKEYATLELPGSDLKYDTENQQIQFTKGDALSFSTNVSISNNTGHLDHSKAILSLYGGDRKKSPCGLELAISTLGVAACYLFSDEPVHGR